MNYLVVPGLKSRISTNKTHRHVDYKMIPDWVIQVVIDHYQVSMEQLRKRNRTQRLVHIRRILYYFLYKYTTLNLREIGDQMNGLDHTTVIHSLNALKDLRSIYPEIEAEILIIDSKL